MFDIGFFELSLIGVVALVVIGPERLPAVARSAGKWIGRANRFISNIKDDISKEMKSEELQSILDQQQKLADDFKQATDSTSSTLNKLKSSTSMDDLLEINEPIEKKKKKKKKKKKSTKVAKASNSAITSTKVSPTENTADPKPVEDKSNQVSNEETHPNRLTASELESTTNNNQTKEENSKPI
jgi:sec-independent protein translocase protein TatB